MYTALYSIFLFLAPIFDERYRKKHGLGRFSSGKCFLACHIINCAQQITDEEDGTKQYQHIPYPSYLYQTPPQSSDPYSTIVRSV
jgi:hypothetical protein